MSTIWTVAVDWERSGNYDGVYDDISTYVIEANWFLGMRTPYQSVADNTVLKLTVKNTDQRFSPEYVSSPLNGMLEPFRPIRIQADDGSVVKTLWLGWVQSIQPRVNQHGERIAEIMAEGPMHIMQAKKTGLPIQELLRTDEVIRPLLAEAVIPPATTQNWVLGRGYLGDNTFLGSEDELMALEEGELTLTLAGDNWVRSGGNKSIHDEFDVYRAIQDVTNAERGRFFFNREGKAVFWNRDHLLTARTPVATFDDSMTDLEYAYAGSADFQNEIIVGCHPRSISESPNEILWQLEEAIVVPEGGSRTIQAKYEDESGGRVGGRDAYVTPTFSQGFGIVQLDDRANNATLTVKNSWYGDAVLESCEIRGTRIVDQGRMNAVARDYQKIAEYGRRSLNIDAAVLSDFDEAEAIADLELERRKYPRGTVQSITLKSHGLSGGGRHDQQITRTIGDVITVRETQTAHEEDYYIIGEAHRLGSGATLLETMWYLEPVSLNWLAQHDKRYQDTGVSLKRQTTLTDDLKAWWSFEENSGTREDSHGSNDLTDYNTVTVKRGIREKGAHFTAASSEYLSIADNADLSAGDVDFTMAAWVKPDSNGSGYKTILSKWGGTKEYILRYKGNIPGWAVEFVVSSDGSAEFTASIDEYLYPDTWYFIVAWHDSVNDQIGLMINETVRTFQYSDGVKDAASDFRVGQNGSGGEYMDGTIDELAFWKRVLTSQERGALYNQGKGVAYSSFGVNTSLSQSFKPNASKPVKNARLWLKKTGSPMGNLDLKLIKGGTLHPDYPYGEATDALYGSVSASSAFTHEADCRLAFTIATLPIASGIDIRFRRQSGTNTWAVTCNSSGNFSLYEVVSGVWTLRGVAAGVLFGGEEILITCEGETISGYYDGVQAWQYTGAANFKTETGGEVAGLGTGGAISNLAAYPYPAESVKETLSETTDTITGIAADGTIFTHAADCDIIYDAVLDPLANLWCDFRMLDTNNRWMLETKTDGSLILWSRIGGTWTNQGDTSSGVVVSGDSIRIHADDETIQIYVNGNLHITKTGASSLKTETGGMVSYTDTLSTGTISNLAAFPYPLASNSIGISSETTDRIAGNVSVGTSFTHDADFYLCFDLDTFGAATIGIRIRWRIADANNFWQLNISDTGGYGLYEVISGTFNLRASSGTFSAGGALTEILAEGSTITLRSNGSEVTSYTGTGHVNTATSGTLLNMGSGGAISDLIAYPYPGRILDLSSVYEWADFLFDTPPYLMKGTTYHLVLETTNFPDQTSYIEWGAQKTPYTDGLRAWWALDEEAVSTDDLVSWWALNEESGTRADSHASNDLTDNNTVTSEPGLHGNAAHFDPANNEYLSHADNADLSMGDIDFTIMAWVYMDDYTNPWAVTKWGGSPDYEYNLYFDTTTERFWFAVSDDGTLGSAGFLAANSFGKPGLNRWYCLFAWHDAASNEIGISVNGVEDTVSWTSGVYNGASPFTIGTGMDGRIDEVAIWKRLLASEERTWLYNSGHGRAYAKLSSGERRDSHSNHDLTDHNTATGKSAKLESGVQLVAANSEYLSCADTDNLSTGDVDFTIAAWVKLDSLPSLATIISKWANPYEYTLRYNSGAGAFEFYVSSDGTLGSLANLQSTAAVAANTWYFVMAWHDSLNDEIGIRVNETEDTTSYSSGLLNTTSELEIGAAYGGAEYWNGIIDETAFWKRVLSTEERDWLYNEGRGRNYADANPYSDGTLKSRQSEAWNDEHKDACFQIVAL